MPNRATHESAGALVGGLVGILDTGAPKWLANPATGALIGKTAGRIPDILEPAHSPNHRKFFHSWACAGLIAYGMKTTYEWQPEDDLDKVLKWALLVAVAACVSHLVLDSLTKRSLPIV